MNTHHYQYHEKMDTHLHFDGQEEFFSFFETSSDLFAGGTYIKKIYVYF